MVTAARAANPDKVANFFKALDRAVQGTAPKQLLVRLSGPYANFRSLLDERIRKVEPIEQTPWREGVLIAVVPKTITAPDISKIIVQRDGVTMEPTENELKATPQKSSFGVERVIHSGVVTYSCAAFASGATVTITAIPESGSNIVKVLKSEQLATIR